MKYIDEFRDRKMVARIADHIKNSARGNLVFMEVCGGHTSAIHRFGIRSMLPENIKLISGPGCPVCVTGRDYIDKAVACAQMNDVTVATFGDLLRVPGNESSLEKEKAAGADVRVVFSGIEALDIAISNPEKKVVFLGIGFETTAPGTAVTIIEAKRKSSGNFFLLSAHKTMPPAMEAVIRDGTNINGFICPGHVAAVTGSGIFDFIPEKYGIGCVVTGFEPMDIMQAILMLVGQVNSVNLRTEIQYRRAVTIEGNPIARKYIKDVFETCDVTWRGFGIIKQSGLRLRREYEDFDAENLFSFVSGSTEDEGSCICGEILRGRKSPSDCSIFGKACTPDNPVGACMVSVEGACNAWFKYGNE
ncbi:MAG: hydrogenase formation protein HypD [Bacteroidales bacterium]|jgi:hydrogenase expression/formation protein HypD